MKLFRLLLLSFLVNDLLLMFGLFRKTYDAYTHVFFASHYQKHWFESWNSRWFGGFDQLGYPPLTHQLMALIASFTRLDISYGVLQLGASLLITLGIFRFARELTSEAVAEKAALLSVFSPVLVQCGHMFGQLPMLLSLGVLLNGLAYLVPAVRQGNSWTMAAAIIWLDLVATAHHVTLFFGAVFFIVPVCWILVQESGHFDSVRFRRVCFCGILCFIGALVLSAPFLAFLKTTGAAQVEIPHGTRDNFLVSKTSLIFFFLIPYSTFLLVIPMVLPWAFKQRAWRPFATAWVVLFILGLGGTTPLAKIALGSQFHTLTMERFTLWAIVLLHLMVPAFFAYTEREKGFRLFCGGTAMFSIVLSTLIRLFPFQPDAFDVKPIADFLDSPRNANYRYLTLGFGSQFAWLNALTASPSIDGAYFTARLIPELRTSGIESLDGAKYFGKKGEETLAVFLRDAPRFALRFVASNDVYYAPMLRHYGWQARGEIVEHVQLWERPEVPPVRESDVVPRIRHSRALMLLFGSYPAILVLALILAAVEKKRRVA